MAKTYDPAEVQLIFGTFRITGFYEGSMIKVEYNEDAWMTKIGAAGEGARSKTNDESAKVTIVLMQTADANDALTEFYELDRLGNAGQFPLLIKDGRGRSLHHSTGAWIKKLPAADYGRDINGREWVFETTNLKTFIGGNS